MKLVRRMTLAALIGSAASCLASCNPKIDKGVSVDCSGFYFTTENMAFFDHEDCGYQDAEGVLHISPETMKLFKPDEFEYAYTRWGQKGLRCSRFRLSDGTIDFGYLAADGRARISDYPYDNNCQPFRNGVAISYVDGKAIFFDKNLEVVKATDYALADSFYKDLARVCRVSPEKKYDTSGDHFDWIGGTCGYIDTEFNVVTPIETPYEETERLAGGSFNGRQLSEWKVPVLEFLMAALKYNTSPVEAVFGPSGCKLDFCSEKKKRAFGLPRNVGEIDLWITTLHFRLEDQSLWEGHVLSNRDGDFTSQSLRRIKTLPASASL